MLFNSTDEFNSYSSLEARTFALILKIDEIEANSTYNPNGLDYLINFSIDYEEKKARGTITMPCVFKEVSNANRSEIEVLDVYNYNYTESDGGDQLCTNISGALYQSISAQFRAEKSVDFNPAQVEYLTREIEDVEIGELGANCLIAFDFDIPVISSGNQVDGKDYLQGNYTEIFT